MTQRQMILKDICGYI